MSNPFAQRLTTAAVAALAAVAIAGCGAKKDVISPPGVKPFSVMLDYFPNADHAALYEAIHQGDFRDVGLDVTPETPSEPSAPLKLLAAGKVDMAISYEPEVFLARAAGLKVVSIAALVQRPLTSIIALPGHHVKSVASLAHKKVGTAGIEYQAAELKTALRHAGVNPDTVTEVNVGYNIVAAMLSGKVAATLGGFWNYEAIQLRLMGKHPLVIPINEAGVPNYNELVLVVNEHEARYNGQELRSFLQALTQGERKVIADPAQAARFVEEANTSLEPKLQLESIKATLSSAKPSNSAEPYGYQNPAQWAAFGRWMFDEHLIAKDPGKEGLPPFTNEYLPGQGITAPGEEKSEESL